ncbi:ABC transporter permease [soil metagenome]
MKLLNTTKLSAKKQRVLLSEMIRTDFKLRYQGSILGYVWSVLKPLFLFAILYTVFTQFLRIGAGIPNYGLSLLLGIVLWNFFAEATSGALKSIVAKGSLIRKVDIPRYLIPVTSIASAFINMMFNLLVVFIFAIFTAGNALSWMTLLIFPLLLIELLLLTLAVSYFLSAVYVKLRDIDHIWEIIKQALFYGTPIIYPIALVPSEVIQKLLFLNPLAQIIQDARNVVSWDGNPRITDLYANDYVMLVPIALISIALFIGLRIFSKKSNKFAEYV